MMTWYRLHEFLDMDEDEREGRFPYIWGVNAKNHLIRIICSAEMVLSCEERRSFWHQLKGVAGEYNQVDVDSLVEQTKADMANRLSSTLLSLVASGNTGALSDSFSVTPAAAGGSRQQWCRST